MAKELLTDVAIRNTKPQDKDIRLSDGSGLYLLIKPSGARWWRFDYTIKKVRKTLSVGVYPAVSLLDARRKAAEARSTVANGTDPSDVRKSKKAEQQFNLENQKRLEEGKPALDSFEHVALEWFDKMMANKSENYKSRVLAALKRDTLPWRIRFGSQVN